MTRLVAAALLGISLMASTAVYAGERTVTLAVPGMDCASCPIIVKSSLEAVPGIVKVVVSLADKTAVVTFDDTKTALPALMTAMVNAGYPSAVKG